MKHYSVKFNEEQFDMLHKALSEAETILSESTDYFNNIKKRGLAISALKSKDRLVRKIWELLWLTESCDSLIRELELLCHQGDAVYRKANSSFDEFMDMSDDYIHDFNIFIHDYNLNGGVWVCYHFYGLQITHTLHKEVEKHKVTI